MEEEESCWVEEERPSFWRMHLGTANTVEGTSELTLLNTFVKKLSHSSVQNSVGFHTEYIAFFLNSYRL